MATVPSCNCEQSTCASYLCACKLQGEYCNDLCFCSGRACSNRADGMLYHSPRNDSGYLARLPHLAASSPLSTTHNWSTLPSDTFGSPLQIHASVFSNTLLSHSSPALLGSPGSPPASPSKMTPRSARKKQVSALNIPRTTSLSPTSVPWGSPTSFLPAHLQPRFYFNNGSSRSHPGQYEADRTLFLQNYMLIAEEFLYAFLESWHAKTIESLNLFRDTSELGMDEQLYLGSDCLARLLQENSQLNPQYVEVMPSREGFDIGIALTGDLKSGIGIISAFSMEIFLKNDGAWFIYSMKAV